MLNYITGGTYTPAQQPGLAPLDQRAVEQGLRIDRVAGFCAREQVGDDRIGLGKGQQDRMADDRLAAADELRDAAIAAGGESAAISAMAIDIPRHWA